MRTHDKHALMRTDPRCTENSTKAFQQLNRKVDARPRSTCFAVCKNGPILVVYPEGVWYPRTDGPVRERIVSEHLENNIEVSEHVIHRLGIGDV